MKIKEKRNFFIKAIFITILFLLFLFIMQKNVKATILEESKLPERPNTRSNYENLIVDDKFITRGQIVNDILVGAGANPTTSEDKSLIKNGEDVVFTISSFNYDVRIENKEDIEIHGATNYEIEIESNAWFLDKYVDKWTVTIKNIKVLETEEKKVNITFKCKWKESLLGTVYTENAYTSIIVDNIPPKISINPNEQTNYTNGTEVTITATDLGGLKENQSIQYAWSESSTIRPTEFKTLEGINVTGATSTTWTIPKSESQNLTGEYYLWIKEGTIADRLEHKNNEEISQKFLFDGTPPTNPTVTARKTNQTGTIIEIVNGDTEENVSKTIYTDIKETYLQFSGGTDANSGVETYAYATSPTGEKTDAVSLSFNTTETGITYYIFTKDKAGNYSEKYTSVTVKLDVTRPEITQITPDKTQITKGTEEINTVTYTVAINKEVKKVEGKEIQIGEDEIKSFQIVSIEPENASEYATKWKIKINNVSGNGTMKLTIPEGFFEDRAQNKTEEKTNSEVNVIKQLESIAVTTAPTKTKYIEEQDFDKTGMVVTATYTDESTQEITTYTVEEETNLTKGKTSVTIRYEEDGVTKETTQEITVVAKQLESIAIKTAPTKIKYIEGQDFDKTGMVVIATYNDGSTQEITTYTIEEGTNLTKEKTSVTIRYEEDGVTKETTQDITVVAKKLESIAIKTEPTKREYVEGQSFDKTGMIVTATYNDGSTQEITTYTIEEGTNLTKEKTSVTIKYEEDGVTKETTQEITVAAKELTGIEVVPPTNTENIKGQELNTTGMKITAVYNDGTKSDVEVKNEYLTGYDKNTIGEQVITVTYESKTATFKITVIEQTTPATNNIIGMVIKSFPTKINYKIGEEFNKTGLVTTVIKEDGTTESITESQLTITKASIMDGKYLEITVEYSGFTNRFTVAVESDITKITVTKKPNKIEYQTGDNFDPEGLEITTTDKDQKEVIIKDSSKISIAGFDSSKTGTQTITISYAGQTTSFDITVGSNDKPINQYEIKGEYIINIEPETTIKQFVSNLVTDSKIEIYDETEKVTNESDMVKTGMKLKLTKGSTINMYKLVVNGDVNGSGKISVADVTLILRHRVEKLATNPNQVKMLADEYLQAADFNKDGDVNLKDLVLIITMIVENK